MFKVKRPIGIQTSYEINSLAFSPDGLQLATSGCNSDGVEIFDVSSSEKLGSCEFTKSPIVRNGIQWSSAGLIASIDGISGNCLRIWSDKSFELIKEIAFVGCRRITSFEFDTTGQKLLISYSNTSSLAMSIRVYDITHWDFETIESTEVEVTRSKWFGTEIICAGRSTSTPHGLTVSRINTDAMTFEYFPISESMCTDVLLDVMPVTGDVCVAWTGLSPRDSTLHVCTLNIANGSKKLKTRHFPKVTCSALKFFRDSGDLALDMFDDSEQPIKIVDAHTQKQMSLHLGLKRTSGGFDVSHSRKTIAVAVENVALILTGTEVA